MISTNIEYFKRKPMSIRKITILVDNGYKIGVIQKALEEVYPQIMKKIRFEVSEKPSKAEKEASGKVGFIPEKTRWVIERSNAWVERCKSLVKNFERTLENAKAKLDLCFVRLMVKRLAAL